MEDHGSSASRIPTELVARLEAASVGSRELDAAIWCATNDAVMHRLTDFERAIIYTPRSGKGMKRRDDYAAYTTSLDAALALAERVLPGWRFSMATITPPWVQAYPPGSVEDCLDAVAAETLPLAMCLAILKATTANAVGTAAKQT